MRTRCVKVTAHMASGICGHVPMLDGILSAAMGIHMPSVRNTRHGDRHAGPDCNGWANVPIPIASRMFGGWRIPCASSPIYRVRAEDVAHISRVPEFDLDAIRPGGANKINVTSGSFKGMRLPKRVLNVERVVWFAVARNFSNGSSPMACMRRLLKQAQAIGSKWAAGFGRVERWEVEPVDEDWSWFAPSDEGTVLMRPLPVCDELPADLVGHKQWFDRPAPPYHDKSTACEVVVPC